MKTVPLHFDCAVCQAGHSNFHGMSGVTIAQTSAMTLLVMLQTGSDLESVVKDMCFVHRKQVAQAVKNVEKEKR